MLFSLADFPALVLLEFTIVLRTCKFWCSKYYMRVLYVELFIASYKIQTEFVKYQCTIDQQNLFEKGMGHKKYEC
jgi:hypothetical protein